MDPPPPSSSPMDPQSPPLTPTAPPSSSPVARQSPPPSPAAPPSTSLMEPQSPPLLAVPPPVSSPDPDPDSAATAEALHLKSLAESKLRASSLKSALKYARRARAILPSLASLNHLVTALKILRTDPSDHYRILRLDPFSPISAIKKQYKSLALILHPDKSVSTVPGAEDAFKRVADSFRFLSDRNLKKNFDNRLRIALSAPAAPDVADGAATTFWTACTTCRLLHEFDRRYIGQRLMCPVCHKSFLAAEVPTDTTNNTAPHNNVALPQLTASRSGINTRPRLRVLTAPRVTAARSRNSTRPRDLTEWTVSTRKRKPMTPANSSARKRPKPVREKTLAEIQLELMAQKQRSSNSNVRGKGVKGGGQLSMQSPHRRAHTAGGQLSTRSSQHTAGGQLSTRSSQHTAGGQLSTRSSTRRTHSAGGELSLNEGGELGSRSLTRRVHSAGRELILTEEGELSMRSSIRRAQPARGELTLMAVEDSDFYDFDKDRMEKCFAVGQVWGIYDDDDGMPRHYGLINAVLSKNPFRVKMSWLDAEGNGEGTLLARENARDYISCGRFKVGRKIEIESVNFFSHLVDYERAAKEVYRIYPKKGSVWALYCERGLGDDEERSYDIVVCLASYKDMFGMSMGYLEKVEGFKTIFKRREVGAHAVRWLKKDDMSLLSHQVPARKVVDVEGVELPKDCWELDPASLPPGLLQIDWERE